MIFPDFIAFEAQTPEIVLRAGNQQFIGSTCGKGRGKAATALAAAIGLLPLVVGISPSRRRHIFEPPEISVGRPSSSR